MSALSVTMLRWLARSTIRLTSHKNEKGRYVTKPGAVKVKAALGGEQELWFEQMFHLNTELILEDDVPLLDIFEMDWPEAEKGRDLHPFGEGMTLCDASLFLRGAEYGIGLMQFGEVTGVWRLVYDPNVTCPHADEGRCVMYCTMRVEQYTPKPPRRKKKKQREPFLSKFRLPDLFPERGLAIP